MGLIIILLTILMHLSVYWAGHRLAYNPSFVALVRNVVFVSLFVMAIAWLQRRYRLRASKHVIYVALLLTAIGTTVQYRVSYDIWASSTKSSIAMANKRRFLRDKINILFIQRHPEFKKLYSPPDSPHEHITWQQELSDMVQTLAKMSIVLVVFAGIVILQMRGSLAFLEGNYLLLGLLTFLFTLLLGGVTAVFGGAAGGGSFLANMTPWEILKIPLVLTMTGFVITMQPYFHGERPVGGDRMRFLVVMLLLYLSPLWIFLLIRDFGQLWIMTFFYTLAFYVSTRRVLYPLLGFVLVVGMFVLALAVIPSIQGLSLAIWLHNWFWLVALVGALAIFGGYVVYVIRTRKGSPVKLGLALGGMASWVFITFAMPPYLITLFGVGDMDPHLLTHDFMSLPQRTRTKFLEQAPTLVARLSTVLTLSDSPDELSSQLAGFSKDEMERRLAAWRMCETFGRANPPVSDMAAMLKTWPSEHIGALLSASSRFRDRLATQLGTVPRIPNMLTKLSHVTQQSLEERLGTMGQWEPSPNLGVLATPMRRITSWWLMWGILTGSESPEIYDEDGPYWRTLDHLFRGFFAMEHGGWLGQGLGMGNPTFVPKAINDFVYVTLSEEMGWIGTGAVLVLYIALVLTIILVGQRSTNNYWRLVTINFAILFWAQVFVNVGGVVGFMPLTGIPLPFISRGFFSMLTSFAALGIVVGISHRTEQAPLAPDAQASAR